MSHDANVCYLGIVSQRGVLYRRMKYGADPQDPKISSSRIVYKHAIFPKNGQIVKKKRLVTLPKTKYAFTL